MSDSFCSQLHEHHVRASYNPQSASLNTSNLMCTNPGYAKKAIYANTPAEAYYPTAAVDADGQILDGQNNYTITFPAGQLPPAKFFWSITMYDNAHQLLVANELKRYSIGDRTKSMKPNADGSLTIYIGNKKPSVGTGNWLPAPPAGFNLMMRIYGPKEEVLNGHWSPPAVVKSR